MGKYFGTDGFRGEANKVLTADHAYKIGRYLGWYYNQNHRGRIIIGKDTRRSSYMFEYALVAGITASGADAFLLHVTTTPSVAYVVLDLSVYRSYDGMCVGLDCSNGSTFNIAKSVFDALDTKTYVVGNEPDGTNINMGSGSVYCRG